MYSAWGCKGTTLADAEKSVVAVILSDLPSDALAQEGLRPRVLGLRPAAQSSPSQNPRERQCPTGDGSDAGASEGPLLFISGIENKSRFFSPANSAGLQNDTARTFSTTS